MRLRASYTGGHSVDFYAETAGGSEILINAMQVSRKNGKNLFAAALSATPADFQIGKLLAGRLTLRPCRGHSYESVELGLRFIKSGRFPLHLMAKHRFGLAEVDPTVRPVGRQGAPGAVHVTVLLWS
jgi:threonine dehydrogenase-like Zn-dependent dehydrogenase